MPDTRSRGTTSPYRTRTLLGSRMTFDNWLRLSRAYPQEGDWTDALSYVLNIQDPATSGTGSVGSSDRALDSPHSTTHTEGERMTTSTNTAESLLPPLTPLEGTGDDATSTPSHENLEHELRQGFSWMRTPRSCATCGTQIYGHLVECWPCYLGDDFERSPQGRDQNRYMSSVAFGERHTFFRNRYERDGCVGAQPLPSCDTCTFNEPSWTVSPARS